MIILTALKNNLVSRPTELITSGSVNVYPVQFRFSSDWDGLVRTAVFRAGGVTVSILLGGTDECTIPWEVLARPNCSLEVGVYGTQGGEVVLPTVWARLGTVQEGTGPAEGTQEPTPTVYEQILRTMGSLSELTTQDKSSLVAAINEAAQSGGGGAGGTGNVSSNEVYAIKVMDRADYEALAEKSPTTLYLIKG